MTVSAVQLNTVPYDIQSKYTRINPFTEVIEEHNYISVRGAYPIHQVVATSFKVYDKTGKEIQDAKLGNKVDILIK